MSSPFLTIGRMERRLTTGNTESLVFTSGVNLLVGVPNTGKTKWLQLLDYLLADTDPIERHFDEQIVENYDSASAEIKIGDEVYWIERRWKQLGAKTKIFVDGEDFEPKEFQHFLLSKLDIPILNFPKGNPLSGQTWPELSFRSLLRHLYRQQRFWNDLADLQPEAEQRACILQFTGLAEKVYSDEYGRLIQLQLEVSKLKARREQYGLTLNQLANEVLYDGDLSLAVSEATIRATEDRISNSISSLYNTRNDLISGGKDKVVPAEQRGRTEELSQERASLTVRLDEVRKLLEQTRERRTSIEQYGAEIREELDRLSRVEDAGEILADLRITHCPACDQKISESAYVGNQCLLCHQTLPEGQAVDELATARLRFEKERLSGEVREAEQLVSLLNRELNKLEVEERGNVQRTKMIDNELAPARQAVSAFVREELSAVDMALGELNEQQRQISRLRRAFENGQQLSDRIAALEKEIGPLQTGVDRTQASANFEKAEEALSNGINEYLDAINRHRPQTWRHSGVYADISPSRLSLKIGTRRWQAALGATDQLYFLMAYQYALLTLSAKEGCHYPGLSIIDLPGDFLGVNIRDQENFIVQPFIDLLSTDAYKNAQVIVAGASFEGLQDVHRQRLTHAYVG